MSRNRQRRATQSMSPDQLQERRRQLRQAYQADFHLLVRCGHCPNRRLLDELALAHDVQHDSYSLVSMLPTSARPGSAYGPGTQVADQDGNPLPGGVTRPSVTRAKGAFGRPESNPRGHDVWIYECHIRCGATHTFNEESMIRFYLRAFGKGQPALIAGVDSLP